MSFVGDAAPWPALMYEELPWKTSDDIPMSRSARRRAKGPYLAAIVPEIRTRTPLLPPETVTVAEEAATEISRFDAELGHEIAPFAAILLRSESAASSKIENLTASARAIAQAELTGHADGNASLIVANERAMRAALELAGQIDGDTILQMHEALLGPTQPDIAGRWRGQQVWIGGGDVSPHDATFVPPCHERVPAAIEDLIGFIDRDDLPVLAQAALAHAQFETIHPFPDGNGRTGRALIHAEIRNKRLTRNVTVPVSAGLLIDTDAYFEALTAYRHGDAVPIVDQLAAAAFAAVANGRQLVDELRTVRAGWADTVSARRGSNTWRIADLLLRHPVVNARLIATETGIAAQNTYRALTPLVDAGVAVEFSDKKRNQMWRSPEVLGALEAFAGRAGRRSRASG